MKPKRRARRRVIYGVVYCNGAVVYCRSKLGAERYFKEIAPFHPVCMGPHEIIKLVEERKRK